MKTRKKFARTNPHCSWLIEALEPRRMLSVGPVPPVPTPAAHWTFDEGTGTTAYDSSGNGFNGTLGSGVSWISGNVGLHAISLDGNADAVVTVPGAVVNTAASFTASAWVELNNLSGFQTVLSIAGNTVAGFYLGLRGDTGAFSFARLPSDANGNATVVAAPSAPVTGQWYHIVGVDDASAGTLSLYVDGQDVGSVPYTGGWQAAGNTLIGHGFYGGGEVDYVNGSVDDVQFFSSALTSAQVAALDQPADYSFDDGTGTTATDVSGHGNTLSLGSGASWAAGVVGSNSLGVNGTTSGNATYSSPVINTALPFSVSAWVNLTSTTGNQTFVSIDGTNTSGFYLQLSPTTGTFAFTRLGSDSDSAAVYQASASSAPSTGTWYNLIGVNNTATGQLQLYVDGSLQSTVSYSGGWTATGATVIGGGLFNKARTYFASGDIDDVHFFNSPLSASAAAYFGTDGNSEINIAAGTSGITVSPNLFGAFMEDINYGGDGGIYNDEVRNSGFNDSSNPLNAWSAVGGSGVSDSLSSDTTTGPTSGLTQSGMLNISSGVSASARAGISNAGYFGVGIAPSTSYSIKFYAKATSGFTGPLTVDLESTTGTVWATATVTSITSTWAQYSVTLTTASATPTTSTNLFVISTNSTSANASTIWFGAAYVYPPSYENQANHLRSDLMQMLAALHPAIFRVPGGNYLEGDTYATRFEWANTIGPVQDRTGHFNSAWGYWSTDGMGLDEYLQMAEEAGASPILAVYAGYTLNGQSDTGSTLQNDVTDAVNEIHYVLDPVTTSWGAERAANGHAAPYAVQYVEIGNEDFFSSTYANRYPLFYAAIHAAFPQLKIIATSSSTGGSPFDVLDEHFYESPQWFESNSNYFANVTRGSYQVFIGEYAANQGSPTNDMESALGDASWLLGLERNSDLVTMSSYAPLWVNVNGDQWTPDLIGYNSTTAYGSPSYYAQVVLANNHGTTVVSDTVDGATGLQVLVTKTGSTYYLTVVNTVGTANNATINLSGTTSVSSTGTITSLIGSSGSATNSITNPTNIVPVTTAISGLGSQFSYNFPGYSVSVIKFSAVVDTPTVVTGASASPSPVSGKTTNLSVLGGDSLGESALSYTWSATGPGSVSYSDNGSNSAKSTVATFTAAGTYAFQVTILNTAVGTSVTSTVNVVVNQIASGYAVTPGSLTLPAGAASQFVANQVDQFQNAIGSSVVRWSVASGIGSINSSGVYTAPALSGSASILATFSNGTTLTANVSVAAPVAWYKADSSNGNVLTDSSGSKQNGSLVTPFSLTTGVSGNALSLTGGYASLPTGIVSQLTNFTISEWVNVSALTSWERIFDFGTGTSNYMFLTPDAGGTGDLRFAITTSGNSNEQQLNGPALAANTWTNIAVTLNGSTGTLYVNGVAVATNASMTLNPSQMGSTNQNYLGKSQFSGDPAYSGSIDDLRIYNQALSPAGVLALAAPTVVLPASNSVSLITGTSGPVSVSATDVTAGASSLIYTWSAIGTPPASVNFTLNGSNAAQATTAKFTASGTYLLQVSIENPAAGIVTTSLVTIVVAQTATTIKVTPATGSVFDGQTNQFTAGAYDQFGAVLATQPVFTWAVTGAGSVNSTGLYTAPAAGPASDTVTASIGNVSGSASATVILSVIKGTSGNDAIHLIRAGTNLLVYVNSATPTYNVSFGSLSSLTVIGVGGTDTVNVDFSGGASPVPAGGLLVDGTAGNLSLAVTGTSAADSATVNASAFTLNNSAIFYNNVSSLIFNGNGGADTLVQTAQPANNASLAFNAAGTGGGPSALDTLNISSGIYTFPAPVTGGGFQPVTLGSLIDGPGSIIRLSSASGSSDRSVLILNNLSLATAAKLDLGSNDLILHNANSAAASQSLSTVYADLAAGYATGSSVWTGPGIDSSSAAADLTHLTTLGSALNSVLTTFDSQSVSATDVLVKFTYYGDANLDGKVDGSDYSRIDNGLLNHLTGWVNGDFNYDGIVDGSDYTLIDNAFNSQGLARPSAGLAFVQTIPVETGARGVFSEKGRPSRASMNGFNPTPVSAWPTTSQSDANVWAMLNQPDIMEQELKAAENTVTLLDSLQDEP